MAGNVREAEGFDPCRAEHAEVREAKGFDTCQAEQAGVG